MATARKQSNFRPRTADRDSNQSGERESAGPFRASLPALDAPAPTTDPAMEERVFALLTAVEQEDGRTYPPEWAPVAYEAKRRGYVTETSLRLHLSAHGKQWLDAARAPTKEKAYTMTKIDPSTRLALKDLSHEVKVPMQEVIGHIIDAVHANRDALTRIARRHGDVYPWEAIARLVKGQ
jgi:hypothetical protein